jgi:hypothetical protein
MSLQRSALAWQLLPAVILSLGFTLVLRLLGTTAMMIALFVLLLILFFFLAGWLRRLLRSRRGWRQGPFRRRGNGPDLSGVREPRRPRQPYWPPRAAAADPDTEQQ